MKPEARAHLVLSGTEFEASGREVLSWRDTRIKLGLIGAFQIFAVLFLYYLAFSLLGLPVQEVSFTSTILVDLFFGSAFVFAVSFSVMLYFRVKGNKLHSYRVTVEGKSEQGHRALISYSNGKEVRNHVEVRKAKPDWGTPLIMRVGQAGAAVRGLNSSMYVEIVKPAYNLLLGFRDDTEMKRAYDALK